MSPIPADELTMDGVRERFRAYRETCSKPTTELGIHRPPKTSHCQSPTTSVVAVERRSDPAVDASLAGHGRRAPAIARSNRFIAVAKPLRLDPPACDLFCPLPRRPAADDLIPAPLWDRPVPKSTRRKTLTLGLRRRLLLLPTGTPKTRASPGNYGIS